MTTNQKNSKAEGRIPINQQSAKTISDYIKKHPNMKSNRTAFVIENGKSSEKNAWTLPRQLLRLNPDNHRFTTAVSELIAERIDKNESAEFDMEKKEDIKQIRDMLRGLKPINVDRKEKYQKILNEIQSHSEKYGGNGLKVAGIITADGMYINGNRRDTVLEDLQEKETKKKNGDPSKFDNFEVVICDENITYSDIRQMEIAEQVSVSLRDEYDYLNTAMLIKEEYDNLIQQKGEGKMVQVISQIASRIEGKGPKAIEEYLEYLDFVNHVLKILKIPGEYYRINTKIPGETQPVITIIKEWVNKWTTARDPDQKFLQICLAAAYCQGVFKSAKDDSDEEDSTYKFSSRNHRTFKTYAKSQTAKDLIEDMGFWKTYDHTSNVDLGKFSDKIEYAEEIKKHESWIKQPKKVLNSIQSSLTTIDDALVGSKAPEVKAELESADVVDYFDAFKHLISKIEEKLKRSGKFTKN